MEFDNLDYAILKAVHDAETPQWKTAVHDYLDTHEARLPITNNVSAQTIGRRVDRLMYEGYLENNIISPEELNRELIIAYEPTEKGRAAIEEKREELLRGQIKQNIFPEEDGEPLSAEKLVALMQDEYGFSDAQRDAFAEYDRDEIIAFLTIRYAQKNAVNVLDEGHVKEYKEQLIQHNGLAEAIGIRVD